MTSQENTPKVSTLHRLFPEKRIFLKSDNGTRFVRIGPRQQILALLTGTAVIAWSAVATSVLVISLVTHGSTKSEAAHQAQLYETRLNELVTERDTQSDAARNAQDSFSRVLGSVATIQDQQFESDLDRLELQRSNDALRAILADALSERDAARARVDDLTASSETVARSALEDRLTLAEQAINLTTKALDRISSERDTLAQTTRETQTELADVQRELHVTQERADRIFAQLEDAVTVAMKPMDKVFGRVGLKSDQVLKQMKKQYTGQGGPLVPITLSTMGEAADPLSQRANSILLEMKDLNLYRMAMDKVPFALPVRSDFRYTSGFGTRSDPFTRSRHMHTGADMAGDYGTPIYASADGVVVEAGWGNGYGRMVKIQHEFGLETLFGHLSKINVAVGQRVSRGDRIGAMGSSGRSTGTHLHYEVRVGGTPVNPMTYIKAGSDVF